MRYYPLDIGGWGGGGGGGGVGLCSVIFITKTYLYNVDPLKLHFYIVKLGFTRIYIIFLISIQKNRLAEAVLTSTTIYVVSRNMKNIRFFI